MHTYISPTLIIVYLRFCFEFDSFMRLLNEIILDNLYCQSMASNFPSRTGFIS
jgi:hypothetical protein